MFLSTAERLQEGQASTLVQLLLRRNMKTFDKQGLKKYDWECYSQLAVSHPTLQCQWEKLNFEPVAADLGDLMRLRVR